MTRDQVKEILDRVLTWPPERQADGAAIVELMEEQDRSDLRLTDEQVAEVKRRLADPNCSLPPCSTCSGRLRSRLTARQIHARFRVVCASRGALTITPDAGGGVVQKPRCSIN